MLLMVIALIGSHLPVCLGTICVCLLSVIMLGDLNYRLQSSAEEVLALVAQSAKQEAASINESFKEVVPTAESVSGAWRAKSLARLLEPPPPLAFSSPGTGSNSPTPSGNRLLHRRNSSQQSLHTFSANTSSPQNALTRKGSGTPRHLRFSSEGQLLLAKT